MWDSIYLSIRKNCNKCTRSHKDEDDKITNTCSSYCRQALRERHKTPGSLSTLLGTHSSASPITSSGEAGATAPSWGSSSLLPAARQRKPVDIGGGRCPQLRLDVQAVVDDRPLIDSNPKVVHVREDPPQGQGPAGREWRCTGGGGCSSWCVTSFLIFTYYN